YPVVPAYCDRMYSVCDDGVCFFFQAEDGIRDRNVTGVQTCALPISRRVPAHRTDRRRPVRAAAVREVVTIDRRDHDVLEPELAHGPADPLGLLAILPDGRAVRDRAVAAVAGAHVAQDHERRGRVLPALPDVGTARLLADRVEVPLAHPTLEAHVVGAAGGADLEPRRLAPLRDEARRLDHGK